MDKHIGIDVHAASCTLAVIDARGKQVGSHVVATNGQEFVECLRAIPGQRHVCFEEGTQSGWLCEVLEPHVVEVVVAGVGEKSRGPKDGKRDVFGLAEDFRKLVRAKNRRLYRSRGVAVTGQSVYSSAGRKPWQEQLPEAYRKPLGALYPELDALQEVGEDAEKALVQEAREFSITKLLSRPEQVWALFAPPR
jgi:hypothetical protein